MKVEGSITSALLGNTPRASASASAKAKSVEEKGDAVELSAMSAGLAASDAGEAPIDTSRVEEIKQAIAEGRFQINAGAIADRLIASAQDMIRSQRQA